MQNRFLPDDEINLLYVALTRARRRLLLSPSIWRLLEEASHTAETLTLLPREGDKCRCPRCSREEEEDPAGEDRKTQLALMASTSATTKTIFWEHHNVFTFPLRSSTFGYPAWNPVPEMFLADRQNARQPDVSAGPPSAKWNGIRGQEPKSPHTTFGPSRRSGSRSHRRR